MQFKKLNSKRQNRYKQLTTTTTTTTTTTKHSDGKIVSNLTKDHPEVKFNPINYRRQVV
jgi:hypothetical protein